MASNAVKPACVVHLESAYGPPSQAGFGSAVFHDPLDAADDLGEAAAARYAYFVGALWERFGRDTWMAQWREVHARSTSDVPRIEEELRGIPDRDARGLVPMLLDEVEGPEKARAALAEAFDDPAVSELRVFTLGDGGAMSGLLVAARRAASSDAMFLVLLLD